MKLKAIIFDLDGTLLDTLEDLADASNSVLSEAGLPVHPVESYRYFVGDGLAALIRRILPTDMQSDNHVEQMSMAFRKVYGGNWKTKTGRYDGIALLLDSLREKGLPMNILSNKPHDFTKICVREFLGEWNFAYVVGNREGVPRKPDPAGALEIAGRLGLAPKRIAYVGDTATDMQTAVAAGMYPVGVLWGFRTAGELKDNGAIRLIGHPLELLKLFPEDVHPNVGEDGQKA